MAFFLATSEGAIISDLMAEGCYHLIYKTNKTFVQSKNINVIFTKLLLINII